MGKRGIFQCRILYGKPEPIEVQLSNTKVLLDTVEMDRFVKSIIRRGRTSKDFLSLSVFLYLLFSVLGFFVYFLAPRPCLWMEYRYECYLEVKVCIVFCGERSSGSIYL